MDIFDEELIKFWTSLNTHGVKYIMVGGVATTLNGYTRFTEDIDMWIDDTLENRIKLRAAFKEYGLGDIELLLKINFIPGWTDFHLNNGLRLDILTSLKGLENYTFEESLEMASIANIKGVEIPFLHINQLIINKKTVNRLKDQIDVTYLEKIQEIIPKDENKEP